LKAHAIQGMEITVKTQATINKTSNTLESLAKDIN